MKIVNLVGNKIGKLKVLDKKIDNNKRSYYYCKCECGTEKWIRSDVLRKATSCGCIRNEKSKNNKNLINAHLEKNIIDGTNISIINTDKTNASNKSGIKGVSWNSKRNKWVAQIGFKSKIYNLGRYDKKEDAIKARKEAEERLHKKFLKEKGLIE